MEESGCLARERRVKIASKKGGRTVRIAQVTDLHINVVNDDDMACAEIARTYLHRKWLRDGAAIPAAERALDVCRKADCTVITGDLLDYYSTEAAKVMKRLFDEHPNAMACIGGHDVTLEMETGRDNELPLAQRYALLSEFWPNDVQFAARTIDDKVTLILLNNNAVMYRESRPLFDEEQVALLRETLDEARRNERIVLLFMHLPLFPGRDEQVKDPFNGQAVDLQRMPEAGPGREGYDLIVSSADVIRGVFVGHEHHDFETEIEAGYEENGRFIKQNIPMYGLTANCFHLADEVTEWNYGLQNLRLPADKNLVGDKDGHVLWIEVE